MDEALSKDVVPEQDIQCLCHPENPFTLKVGCEVNLIWPPYAVVCNALEKGQEWVRLHWFSIGRE